ncbi:MAG: alanine--tRNA ligase [Chloroflexi bacterium]|nr:alanine--tRNA ligase [Chloroflexota bacterium]
MTSKPSGHQIRQTFLDFFASKGHTIVPSSSLVPGDDPTLLFTNAGMVQFKDVFLGTDKRPYTRATTVQKCMRVSGKHNDLENVGPSPRHHTFFEMLGNFSFGDYFKREAIHWAYELLTQVYGLDPNRLYYTVHESDDEAYRIWVEEVGVPAERVARMGDKTNFWQMADVGPCGPTSEIHYDFFPERGQLYGEELAYHLDENPDDRFLELWNLVFMQFDQKPDGTRVPLPKTGIDTGMGLERITMVLQGVDNSYDTDLFAPIMARIQELAGHTDAQRAEHLVPYRVIADHTRAATFLIADGVVPGNEGRNYVVRMIIRRAARFGRKIGFTEPFMARVAETVIAEYGHAYPELERNREVIFDTLTREEERFAQTVDSGLAHLEHLLAQLKAQGQTVVPGHEAFRLYATYGLPVELTRDVAREHGLEVDEEGFRAAMEEHRVKSGKGQAMGPLGGEDVEVYRAVLEDLQAQGLLGPEGVEYDPYSGLEVEGPVLALLVDGHPVTAAEPGQEVEVILPRTCFYVEAGGQVSDTGLIFAAEGPEPWEIEVTDTRRPAAGVIVHIGRVRRGRPRVGDLAIARVDAQRRKDIMRNHTATHLLHWALHVVLGPHAKQAGSLVAPDYLRFDFNHPEPLTREELRRIEAEVNRAILEDYPVQVVHKPFREAIAEGAIALFTEKYGETVRTIQIGDQEPFSYELCGGTHLSRTGEIGVFLITHESSVAANVRRIEAVTGRKAYELIRQRFDALDEAAAALKTTPEAVPQRVHAVLAEADAARKEARRLREQLALQSFEQRLAQPERVQGVPVVTAYIRGADADTLRGLSDRFRSRYPEGVVVLAGDAGGRPVFIVGVGKALVGRGIRAGDLAKHVAAAVGGGGGGKPTLAQAGGKDVQRIPEALARVRPWLEERLG